MDRKAQLREIVGKAMDEMSAIEDKEWRDLNAAIVGKCFKYRNNYGSDRPSWWLYARVLSAKGRHDTKVFQFQTDCDGQIQIETKTRMGPSIKSDNWLPIPASEFNRAWRAVQRKVATAK